MVPAPDHELASYISKLAYLENYFHSIRMESADVRSLLSRCIRRGCAELRDLESMLPIFDSFAEAYLLSAVDYSETMSPEARNIMVSLCVVFPSQNWIRLMACNRTRSHWRRLQPTTYVAYAAITQRLLKIPLRLLCLQMYEPQGNHDVNLGLNVSQDEWVAGMLLTLLTEAKKLRKLSKESGIDLPLLHQDIVAEMHAQSHEFLLQCVLEYAGKTDSTSSFFPGCLPIAIAALTFMNSEGDFIAADAATSVCAKVQYALRSIAVNECFRRLEKLQLFRLYARPQTAPGHPPSLAGVASGLQNTSAANSPATLPDNLTAITSLTRGTTAGRDVDFDVPCTEDEEDDFHDDFDGPIDNEAPAIPLNGEAEYGRRILKERMLNRLKKARGFVVPKKKTSANDPHGCRSLDRDPHDLKTYVLRPFPLLLHPLFVLDLHPFGCISFRQRRRGQKILQRHLLP